MLGLLALALASAADEPRQSDFRMVSHSEMDAALRDCGLQQFEIRYEGTYQSDVVAIRDNQLSDDQLRCVFRAQDLTGYILEWPTPLAERYQAVSDHALRPHFRARARAYFSARPAMGNPPMRAAGQSDMDYARTLERFCGPAASGMISMQFGTPTISLGWLSSKSVTDVSDPLGCMLNATILGDLTIGFLGNEKVREGEPAE